MLEVIRVHWQCRTYGIKVIEINYFHRHTELIVVISMQVQFVIEKLINNE